MHCNPKKNLAESWHHLLNNVLKMAISDTVEYYKLTENIKQTELDFNSCNKEEYLPQLNRKCVWSLADLGDYLYQQGFFQDALNVYTQALKKDCDEPSVLNQIIVCLIHLNKYDRAIYYSEILERRATTVEDKALALFNRGYCYKKLANFNEAIKWLRKSSKYCEDPDTLKQVEEVKELNSRKGFRDFMGKVFNERPIIRTPEPQYESVLNTDSSKKLGR